MAGDRKEQGKKPKLAVMNKYVYDAFLWTFSILVELFFREVHPRSSWKVPKEGPVIFVCAPHANQFVDPLMLMRVVKKESDRRIQFLIAEKSMKRKFIGAMASLTGVVPVGRAMDSTKPAKGKIYLPDPINDPTLLRGVDTNFEDPLFQVGGSIVLPKVNNKAATAEILEIKGPEEIRLKRGFNGGVAMQQLTGRNDMTKDGTFIDGASEKKGTAEGFEGSNFQVAPKLDQTEVYDAVHTVLHHGGSIGIFPEGGSHDRTDLLPLKAGVAIMALGTVASKPDCNLKIIPVGMNYFHAHKFRSRAVIEFGTAIDVPAELAKKFDGPGRRDAIGEMLENVRQGLISVTVTTPDYDTLMVIQAVRRLYNSKGTKLPLPRVVELNRRLVQGYERYKDDPRIIELKNEVTAYNRKLRALGLRDHQVQYAKMHPVVAAGIFFYRLAKLLILSILVVPGTFLFSLVFLATKLISRKKAKEALEASNVKVQARDVMATWKLLVAMAVAPAAYCFHVVIGLLWYKHNNIQGYLPDGIHKRYLIIGQLIIYITVTYGSLRFGEVAMDILKSLGPLWKMMNPFSSDELVKLQERREHLATRVNEIINELGPEMYEDFYSKRIIQDPFSQDAAAPTTTTGESTSTTTTTRPQTPPSHHRKSSSHDLSLSPSSPSSPHLPRNESFGDLANQDIFSSRPHTSHTPPTMSLTNLDLVNQCDGFPYPDVNSETYLASINTYYQLRVSGYNYALGYMLPSVVEVFRGVPSWEIDDDARILYLVGGSTADERSQAVETTLLAMRQTGHFKVLDKWRGELYAVYGIGKELLFNVERSASCLFGVVTYGVHLTAFTRKEGELKIWTPRRARTKQTYGGMLDNAVAGGIASGESPFESLVRECGEEASLGEELVRSKAKASGTVTYWYIRDERAGGETNLMQPEVQYVYDLELPEDTIPKPGDDEVEEFYLWGVEEVQEAMRRGEFKPNCALVVLDFLVRHGILTTENERDYIEIVSRLHRKLEFPTL